MALGPSAWAGAETVNVRVVGPADAVSEFSEGGEELSEKVGELSEEDRFVLTVDGSVTETMAALDSSADVDCVLAVLPIPGGGLKTLVDHAVTAGEVPVVAVAEGDAAREAIESGATDVVGSGGDIGPRVEWVAAAVVDGDGSSAVADEATLERLDAFGDGVFLLDRRWRFTRVNDRAADLLDRPVEALVGEHLWRSFPSLVETPVHAKYGEAVRTGEAVTFDAQLPERDVWVNVCAFATPRGIATRIRDVTERVEERRTRERYERILETIDDGIYTLDGNFVITHVNSAVTELTGYDREELVGSHSTLLADEEVIVRASETIREILAGERESGLLEAELERADGSSFPMETHFSAIGFEDGSHGSVGVVRDITDRKQYEQMLTELNRSTNELFRAETKPEVAQLVADTATRVLGLSTAAVLLFSEEESALLPAAWHAENPPAAVGPDDGVLWHCFIDGEPATIDSSNAVDWLGDSGICLPLGEHGILAVASPVRREGPGPSARRLDTLARLLETNAEAALDRVDRRLEITSRERELGLRNEELQHLNRLNELLRDINRSLVEAETREAVERAVCERLASAPSVAFAWIGEYDRTTGAIEPRVSAGDGRGYLDEVPAGSGHEDDEPGIVAARTGDPVAVTNVAEGVQRRPWRQRALSREFRSAAGVPLVYSEFVYGSLAMYADRPSVFDDDAMEMFAELGRTTAYAINGLEAKESLYTEAVVELDLEIPAPSSLATRMAGTVDGELTLEGVIQRRDGGSRLYLTVRDPDEPVEAIETVEGVDSVQRVDETDDDVLVEVSVVGRTVPARFADLGASIRTLVASPASVRAVVELQSGTDVRRFVEAIDESYPGTDLTRRQKRERPIETRRAFLASVEDELTDRQLEVLRTAFLSGYFQWPRSRSGEEIAGSLGIAQSTFNRHLRVAERKLLDRLFDPT